MSDEVSGSRKLSVEPRQGASAETSSSHISVYKGSEEELVGNKKSKVSSVYQSSEEYIEYACDPCKTAGDHTEAHGFCTNCEEYLCGTCFRSHSRSMLSKYHTLLDKDAMPRRTVPHCDPCKSVGDETEAIGYCKDCKEYLCGDCHKSHSRSKLSRHHVLVDLSDILDQNVPCSGDVNAKKEYTYIADIDIKADKDEKGCYITAMTLVSETYIVLCDRDNLSLKLVDIEKRNVKDVLAIGEKPVGLTTLSADQVAVVLQNKCQIQVVSVNGGLSIVRTIRTNGKCVDVKHAKGLLYLSFDDPVRFQIIQTNGEIQKTIKPDSEVLEHCILPRHTAVSHDKSLIYISDWKTNKVLCIDMNGNMISLYGGKVETPGDVTISPFGSIYICNRKEHEVKMMTSDLKESTVELGPVDGLRFPVALCFNEIRKQLYISSGSDNPSYGNYIKVYGWK